MSKENYSALLLGANGLIGFCLLQELLKDDKYSVIYAVSRKGISIEHPKLINILADFHNIETKIKNLHVDHLYSCLGSTKAKTPDSVAYYQVDHDYPLKVTNILKENGCSMISIVSSVGAYASSSNFYLKLKGQTEQDLIACQIPSTNIFRPSLLLGKRNETRIFERISQKLSPLLDFLFVGALKKYRSIQATTVAKAMHKIGSHSPSGVNIYESEDIKTVA